MTFGASSPFDPGTSEGLGKFPGKNAFEKLNTLKTLALGSIVTRSLSLIGHAAFRSNDFSQGIPTAPGATELMVGMTHPRATMSLAVMTAGPDMRPGQLKGLLVAPLATRHSPAGVNLPA